MLVGRLRLRLERFVDCQLLDSSNAARESIRSLVSFVQYSFPC